MLGPGEQLLWSGSPRQVRPGGRGSRIALLAGVALVVAGILLMFFGVGYWAPFLIVGAAMAWTGFHRRSEVRTSEYFLTNRRIVVQASVAGRDQEKVYPLAELSPPVLTEHADGTGTLTFRGAESDRLRKAKPRVDVESNHPLELVAIERPREVMARLVKATHGG